MNIKVNKIRNPDFSSGKTGPTGWVWSSTVKSARSHRDPLLDDKKGTGIQIACEKCRGSAYWSQTVVCKPEEYYRIEAVVTCDLLANDERAGLVMLVQPLIDDKPVGDRRFTTGLHRSSELITIRAWFEAPGNVRRIKISIGIENAQGSARIQNVRFIRILEPDTMCHPLSLPPPPYVHPLPRKVSSVCVCSDRAEDRQLTALLRGYFGDRKVTTITPKDFKAASQDSPALLLPDENPPASIRSLKSLIKLAQERIVVISTRAFTRLTGDSLSLRRIEQPDDPINAKIMYANYATQGFALNDIFPYAWTGKKDGGFVQYQFRKTGALKEFCTKHGFVTFLVSMCDQDATSDRTISLFKETPGGGLFVLDIEPVEEGHTTTGDTALAMYLLLTLLCQTQSRLGQYVYPLRKESEFREMLREMTIRFTEFVVHDEDLPIDEIKEQLITIGRDDESFGLPLTPKPVILVRSGLVSGDVESVYGALFWFKNLLRMPPHACPYADQLASQFRLAWVPQLARWDTRDGFHRLSREPEQAMSIECDGADIAAMIDIVSCPINRTRVVFPQKTGVYQRYFRWLEHLGDAFGPGEYHTFGVGYGESFNDRDCYSWRTIEDKLQVVADPKLFEKDEHQEVLAAGGQVIRIEIPGCDADFAAHSIQRTDITATLLELVIGMQLGIIAVNRTRSSVRFNGFAPIKPGETLIVDHNDPILLAKMPKVG